MSTCQVFLWKHSCSLEDAQANHKTTAALKQNPQLSFAPLKKNRGLVIVVVKNMVTAVSTIKNASDE
jgi:hypothetical protein